jgi:hypothetical protein
MTKNISTHITALLSGATSILALVHPGFVVPPFVEGIAVTVPAIVAGLIEALHFVKTHNLQANLIAADHFASQIASGVVAPVAPVAETPKP